MVENALQDTAKAASSSGDPAPPRPWRPSRSMLRAQKHPGRGACARQPAADGGIAVRFGMGASPLQEALSQLAAEGLVQRLDQRGFRVATADASELQDLIESRCLIEGAALRASIVAGDEAWEERIIAHRRLSRVPRSLGSAHFIPQPGMGRLAPCLPRCADQRVSGRDRARDLRDHASPRHAFSQPVQHGGVAPA